MSTNPSKIFGLAKFQPAFVSVLDASLTVAKLAPTSPGRRYKRRFSYHDKSPLLDPTNGDDEPACKGSCVNKVLHLL